MKNYLNKNLQRANLYQIGSFLVYGTEAHEDPPDHEQCIDQAWDSLHAQLAQQISDKNALDQIRNLIYIYANAIQDAYLELGLKAGARLTYEFLVIP